MHFKKGYLSGLVAQKICLSIFELKNNDNSISFLILLKSSMIRGWINLKQAQYNLALWNFRLYWSWHLLPMFKLDNGYTLKILKVSSIHLFLKVSGSFLKNSMTSSWTFWIHCRNNVWVSFNTACITST